MTYLRVLATAVVLFIAGCAQFNDVMTPGLGVIEDKFDGSAIVRQPPVSSSSTLAGAWTQLGFEWVQRTPDLVFVTVGVADIANVTGVAFNADGVFIENAADASVLTDLEFYGRGGWSFRRFSLPLDNFITVATANDVKMRVVMIDKYVVSSFGPANSGAIVNTKFAPFLAEVESRRQ